MQRGHVHVAILSHRSDRIDMSAVSFLMAGVQLRVVKVPVYLSKHITPSVEKLTHSHTCKYTHTGMELGNHYSV